MQRAFLLGVVTWGHQAPEVLFQTLTVPISPIRMETRFVRIVLNPHRTDNRQAIVDNTSPLIDRNCLELKLAILTPDMGPNCISGVDRCDKAKGDLAKIPRNASAGCMNERPANEPHG